MDDDIRAAVQAWIKKAESDLLTAQILIYGENKHFDTGVYHCQQAAEKSLKDYLTYLNIPFQRHTISIFCLLFV